MTPQLYVLLLAAVVSSCQAVSSLRLTPSHASIGLHGTANFTLTCTFGDASVSTGGSTGSTDDTNIPTVDTARQVNQGSVLRALYRQRILKSKDGVWGPVVEYDWDWDEARVAQDLEGSVRYKKYGGSDAPSLVLTWELASGSVGGEYMCELLADSVVGLGTWQRSSPVRVDVDVPETLHDLVGLLKVANTKLDQALDDIESNEEDIQRALRWQEEFEEARNTWPVGPFTLLMPETGCPTNGDWKTGWIKLHTESSSVTTSANEVSENAHLKKPVLESFRAQNYMTQYFCTMQDRESEKNWPSGTYCTMSPEGSSCPSGFTVGQISFDAEDTNDNTTKDGIIPWNRQGNPVITYCCRNDKSASTPIALPRASPFYLHRYGGSCQAVTGMTVQEESMFFQLEHSSPGTTVQGRSPDSNLDLPNLKLHLCYYE